MHLLKKIRWFRAGLWMVRPLAWVLVYPLALASRRKESNLFFFFDRYGLGGAQRVHLDILNALPDRRKTVYFTRESWDDALKEEFWAVPNTYSREIRRWCENILLRLFTVHFYAWYIRRHPGAVILSSNSTFFYDMLPFLGPGVRKIELLHCFTFGNNGLEFLGLGGYPYLDDRYLVDFATEENIRKQYREYGVPDPYLQQLRVIEPGVPVPGSAPAKPEMPPVRVLYAGRGGPQKRVWLIDRIAKACIAEGLPVEWHFAGTMDADLSEEIKAQAVMHGLISDPEAMRALYRQSHVLLLTSWYEGFPMVIKEAMAAGCVPVVTALPGNLTHIRHGENGLLINDWEDEDKVVEQGIACIRQLAADLALTRTLGLAAYDYAQAHFSLEAFQRAYREALGPSVQAG